MPGSLPSAAPRLDSALVRWACVLVPGLILYFVPIGEFLPHQRHLLAIFLATIIALIARPLPMGATVFLAMALIALTGTLTLTQSLAGFGSPTVWLIFSAFLFAQAVSQTRLSLRIAFFFISRMAHNPLSLGYALAASNLVLAVFVPSDTSRGGIMAPVIRNIAQVMGSKPGPTAQRIGAYLTMVGFHTNYLASAMFLTSMAGNPLIGKFAGDIARVKITWGSWALATIVPGICSFAFIPWLIFNLAPPRLRETGHAKIFAEAKLEGLGPLSRQEKILLVVLGAVILGWLTDAWHGTGNTVVALTGVCALFLTGVLSWEEIIGNRRAWEVLVWFAPLLMMADELTKQGVIQAVFGGLFTSLHGWPWPFALALIALVYFYVHYGFASLTAHISALYAGFLGAALIAGVPPALAALSLAVLSNLNAGLTHYGTGSAPIYFTSGYVSQNTWWSIGFVVCLMNLAIWMGLGPLWWNLVGLW